MMRAAGVTGKFEWVLEEMKGIFSVFTIKLTQTIADADDKTVTLEQIDNSFQRSIYSLLARRSVRFRWLTWPEVNGFRKQVESEN